ncbi:serine/threonine-protein kinase [Actinokineospora bangkokensis]|uniref:non-specific serine/threonine protein kinase n=1 Tax=Actinokineospora bangkokensis TaxID=1193682 RepID=A0A1Q9LCV5_9PSEU|nr:serine/threonine-protein kinase [Actinokineospora bangkokensis]OLR89836.1 serine/threonine protein kinase [Actinokineospora bangkokensis]
MSEDLTGRRLGHYRIDGVLGKGGMSVMYRATDVRLGRRVALKVIAEHLTEDPEFRERFVDEARNTSAIDHANVVPLYDFGEVDGLLYIAMRLVDGSDMASLIKEGPMRPQRALGLLSQVAEALDNLHERGLVHLDVKPANVLVTTRESATEHIYLADFGLTRRGATGHRTRGGDFLGSPTYAAPEHLRGEPVDGRTDQYSLACVLFACLAGRPPFQGQVPEVIQGHLNREPPALTEQVPQLPPAIDDVVRRGMAKTPGQRYATCRELVAAARVALSGAPRQQQRGPQGPGMSPLGPQQTGPQQMGPQQTGPRPLGPQQGGPQRTGPQQTGPQQTGPQQAGHPGQQRSYQPTGQRPVPQQSDPVRLRPPVAPVGSGAFGSTGKAGNRWLVPVVVGVVAVVAIVLAVVFLGGSDPGGGEEPERPGPTIPVGPQPSGDPTSGPSSSGSRKPLPPSITIIPAP